jgi:homoserine kinase type II
MPGAPLDTPTAHEIEAACAAVAQLHAAWPVQNRGPSPAVLARLRVLAGFRAQFPVGQKPRADLPTRLRDLLRRGWDAVARLAPGGERSLRVWEATPFDLRPCVRDLRGDHVLFTGPAVTGVIDYGAMAVDHAASDLARLLGDLAGDDDELFSTGLRAYRSLTTFDAADDLVRLLDRTGTVCSVVGWLVRLGSPNLATGEPSVIAPRLERLVARVERFDSF